MKLDDFIKELQEIKQELHNKEVYVRTPNGLLMKAIPKFVKKDSHNFDLTKENVECIMIGY